ncbi:MAG: phosphoserine phosphatase SerB [Candidatus Planktophila sp.]
MKRLVQLDVDSTFIQQEAIELLAAKAGVLEEVSRITAAAMRGELDFAQSLVARVALLQGLSDDSFVQVQQEITVTDGAAELVTLLHQKGHFVSLVSGGFTNILQPMVDAMKIDFYRANTLEVVDGKLTGKVLGAIIDRAAKADALREFATACGVDLSNTVAIGDGANDLDMMDIAGISIAFNAKPIVEAAADYAIKEPSLRTVAALINL